jgi:hypothetical protein
MEEIYLGPRIGDGVAVQVGGVRLLGPVIELRARKGVAGALVDLGDDAGRQWFPLTSVALRRRAQ